MKNIPKYTSNKAKCGNCGDIRHKKYLREVETKHGSLYYCIDNNNEKCY
jgi:hypothetical protein